MCEKADTSDTREMACVEDCDQILIASSIKDSQGWEENGNRGSQGELEEEETVSDT